MMMITDINGWRAWGVAVSALVLVITPLASADEGWMTDYEAAKVLAVKEKKDLLIDFTGSDWCLSCVAMKKEVWSTDRFKQEAPKHFVLLMLDYPQQKPLSAELEAQNDKLQAFYEVKIFPTILLADAKGRPYASTTYDEKLKTPEAWNEFFAALRQVKTARDEGLKKAEAAQGLDRAKAMYAALKTMGSSVVSTYYKAELEQVMALDTDDTLGLKSKRDYTAKREALETQLEELLLNQKTAEYTKAVDAFIVREKVTGIDLQDLLMTKLSVLGPAELDQAPALLDEVVKVDETTELAERARAIKLRVIEMRQQIEKSKEDPAAAGALEDPIVDEKAKPKSDPK